MREGAKNATLRASRKSVTQFPAPVVSFISRQNEHFVDSDRRRCRREGLLQYAPPPLCFEGERRGSTVWRQLTLLPRIMGIDGGGSLRDAGARGIHIRVRHMGGSFGKEQDARSAHDPRAMGTETGPAGA